MTESVTPDFEKIINSVINRALSAEVALELAKQDIEALTLRNDELLAKVMNVQAAFIREEKRLFRLRKKVKKPNANA